MSIAQLHLQTLKTVVCDQSGIPSEYFDRFVSHIGWRNVSDLANYFTGLDSQGNTWLDSFNEDFWQVLADANVPLRLVLQSP